MNRLLQKAGVQANTARTLQNRDGLAATWVRGAGRLLAALIIRANVYRQEAPASALFSEGVNSHRRLEREFESRACCEPGEI